MRWNSVGAGMLSPLDQKQAKNRICLSNNVSWLFIINWEKQTLTGWMLFKNKHKRLIYSFMFLKSVYIIFLQEVYLLNFIHIKQVSTSSYVSKLKFQHPKWTVLPYLLPPSLSLSTQSGLHLTMLGLRCLTATDNKLEVTPPHLTPIQKFLLFSSGMQTHISLWFCL